MGIRIADSKQLNLEIFSNTTKVYELRFKKNGQPQDITGWVIFFTAKHEQGDSDEAADIKKDVITHAEGTEGKTVIELTTTDTAQVKNLWYDIKYKDVNDQTGILYYGKLIIKQAITQRTS